MTIANSVRNKILIAITVVLHTFNSHALPGAGGPPILPCDLTGRCVVIKGDVLMDDYESTHLTVADQHGKKLYFSYGGSNGETIRYGNDETGRIQSKPGGHQEVALLKILRQTMATQFTPPPSESSRNYWNYLALKHSLFVLDYRCRHNTGLTPWRAVTENWTFGGRK